MYTPNHCLTLVCEFWAPALGGVALRQREIATPKASQVLVKVRAAALNFPDLLMTEGLYQYKPPLPFVMGTEGVGDIVAMGATAADQTQHALHVGQRVCFGTRSGAISEFVVLEASALSPAPQNYSDEEAASYHVGASTAYVSLVVRGQLRTGETLLVHGSSGGMGIPAVKLGLHLGATVIATGTSDEKLAQVKAAGAHHVINVKNGFREQVKALTNGRGANVVYDPVGGDVFDESVRCIAWGGRLLIIGFASGRIPNVAVNWPLIKGFSVVGVRAGEEMRQHPDRALTYRKEILALANQGVFKPIIGAAFDIAQSLEALQALATRKFAGKIVIRMHEKPLKAN